MSGPERLRTLFMSDFHLGGHNCKGERLYHFLCTTEADTIYLIGDILEMNVLTKWPPYHADCIRELVRKALNGTSIIYIPGNHDIFFRSHTGDYGQLLIKTFAVHESIDKRLMLVIHGDVMDKFQAHWLLQVLTWLDRVGNINLWEILRSYLGWFMRRHAETFKANVSRFAKDRGYAGVICGHVHFPEIADMGGFTYLNCGDWTQHCTAISEDKSGQFKMLSG